MASQDPARAAWREARGVLHSASVAGAARCRAVDRTPMPPGPVARAWRHARTTAPATHPSPAAAHRRDGAAGAGTRHGPAHSARAPPVTPGRAAWPAAGCAAWPRAVVGRAAQPACAQRVLACACLALACAARGATCELPLVGGPHLHMRHWWRAHPSNLPEIEQLHKQFTEAIIAANAAHETERVSRQRCSGGAPPLDRHTPAERASGSGFRQRQGPRAHAH